MSPYFKITIMICLAIILLGLALGASAADTPAQATPANTREMILVSLDGEVRAVVFVSTHGETTANNSKDCHRTPACESLYKAMIKRGAVNIVALSADKAPVIKPRQGDRSI